MAKQKITTKQYQNQEAMLDAIHLIENGLFQINKLIDSVDAPEVRRLLGLHEDYPFDMAIIDQRQAVHKWYQTLKGQYKENEVDNGK